MSFTHLSRVWLLVWFFPNDWFCIEILRFRRRQCHGRSRLAAAELCRAVGFGQGWKHFFGKRSVTAAVRTLSTASHFRSGDRERSGTLWKASLPAPWPPWLRPVLCVRFVIARAAWLGYDFRVDL